MLSRKVLPNLLFNSLKMISRNSHNVPCKRLVGKVAIVTASTQGLGFAFAERLCSEGAHVVVSSRRQTNVNQAVDKLKADGHSVLGLVCHVSKEKDRKNLVEETIRKFGGIDILVSNAAANPAIGGVLQCSEAAWDKIFEVNVKNSLQITQEVAPHMIKRKGGSIVFVSSIAGINVFDMLGAYSVSKTTLLGLTKALAREVAPDNIRVNCIAPGIVKTNFSKALFESEDLINEFLKHIPLGRTGEAHEMAAMVAFLCSDDASYITGENFAVAGGMHSRL